MTKEIENIKKEINQMIIERDNLTKKINEISVEITNKTRRLYELSPKYIKVVCPSCGGKGYIQEDNRKRICPSCGGVEYLWMVKYEK